MGRVYRAFQKGIDRDVAVKILHRELSANPTLVTRFHREAKVASRLAHPNVVHVLLVGQLPDGAMYIVMEYLDGMSLQSALRSRGRGHADAPGAAHRRGALRRRRRGSRPGNRPPRLKPENVMLIDRADDPDFVKVLDFGIARGSTGANSPLRPPRASSSERPATSRPRPRRANRSDPGDVYSIATMVFQMLAGRTPFEADQVVALLVAQIHDPPPHLQSIARSAYVPGPIAAAVMKNLSKTPADRADDARTFGRELLEAAMMSGLSVQEILARPSLMAGPRGSRPGGVQLPSIQRTDRLELDPEVATRMSRGGAPASGTEALRATKTTRVRGADRARVGGFQGGDARHRTHRDLSARGARHRHGAMGSGGQSRRPTRGPELSNAGSAEPTSVLGRDDHGRRRGSTQSVVGPTRALVLMVGCFLVGALGMAAVAWTAGLLGRGSPRTLSSLTPAIGWPAHRPRLLAALDRAKPPGSHQAPTRRFRRS